MAIRYKLLFIGESNSSVSQMAEAFTAATAPAGVQVMSAGLCKGEIHPLTRAVILEAGIDISGKAAKSIEELGIQLFDVVVVLNAGIKDIYPVRQGMHGVVYWNLQNPLQSQENGIDLIELFRRSREEVKRLVNGFFNDGYFWALATLKDNAGRILDNLEEGIVAHDLSRRIFFFNTAAEKITGYKRNEVLGQDCHKVFPGGFCGKECSFREKGLCIPESAVNYPLDVITRDGEKKYVEMSVVPMKDNAGRAMGVLASYRDQTRVLELEKRLGEIRQFSGIIGQDHKMIKIFELIGDVALSPAPVLIQGETGTGKELVAAAIHNKSPRSLNPFVAVNCAALPEGTIESELFGHVRGAFTGAVHDKKGRFELADGGTIFLDEVGELPPSTQVKLLRVLQENTFERVGGEKPIRVDVRLVSATNRNLKEMIDRGLFREDLFYRLCVVPVTLPPLRERRNDIVLLAEYFLKKFTGQMNLQGVSLSGQALSALMDFGWPGNVRQLQNAIWFSLIKCKGKTIHPEHLPPEITEGLKNRHASGKTVRTSKLTMDAVQKALDQSSGNKARAAKILGVGRATLYRFLDRENHKDSHG